MKMKNEFLKLLIAVMVSSALYGCSSPEEKAQKYYDKGMSLLDTDPNKAKLEFQNALQIKKNMVEAVYGLALASEKQADWKATFGLLNKVIAEKPDHLDANVKIGQMFLAAGNMDQAKEFLSKAKGIDAGAVSVKLLDAAIDLKNKDGASAVAKANQILKYDAQNQQALMILATERYQQKDYDQAIVFIDKAINSDQSNIAFRMFKAKILKSNNDYDGVVAVYQSLLKEYPEKTFIRESLAQYYFKNNKLAASEKQLKKIIELSPDALEPKLTLIKFISSTQGKSAAQALLEKMVDENESDYKLAFYLVDFYDRTNNEEASNKLLEKIIASAKDKPEGLKAKTRKAYHFTRNNNLSEANSLIKEVLEDDDGFPEALMLKSSLQLDTGDYDGATLTLRRLLRDQPDSVDGLFLMAKVQELMGSTALADESYVQAMAASKDSPKVGIAFAKSLVARKQYARAKKILSSVLKSHPKDIDVNKYLAQLSILNGDLEKAREVADALERNSNKSLSSLIDGAVELSNKNFEGALREFKKAYEANPNDIQAIMAVVNTYYSQKQYNQAISFLKNTLKKQNKNSYAVRLLLAQVYEQAGKSDFAVKAYQGAISQQPKNIRAYQGLAATYVNLKQVDKARDVIQDGLSVVPSSFDLKMLIAELNMLEKKYEDAMGVYDELRKSYPHSLVALNNYVSVVSDYENDVGVIEDTYVLAQKLSKTNAPRFLDTLGWISYRNGKHDEAVNYLSQAVKKTPYYAVFQYHLGKAYLAKGNNTKAKKHLVKALELAKNQKFSHTDDIKSLLENM